MTKYMFVDNITKEPIRQEGKIQYARSRKQAEWHLVLYNRYNMAKYHIERFNKKWRVA